MEPDQTPNNSFNTSPESGMPPVSPSQPMPTAPSQPLPPQQPYAVPQPQQSVQPGAQFFQPMTGVMPQQQVPVSPEVMVSPPKKGKPLLVIGICVLLLLAGLAIAALLLNKKSTSPVSSTGSSNTSAYAASEDSALSTLKQKGTAISATALSSINKTDLFFAAFRNASLQTTVVTTKNEYWTPGVNGTPVISGESNNANITQAGYDYSKEQFSYQSNVGGIADKCVNGVDYFAAATDASATWAKSPNGNGDCQVADTPTTINDSLNTGGLSGAQAQKFVDAVRSTQGLVTVTSASLVTEQGKPYVRLNVTVDDKTKCSANSIASGTGCFNQAFSGLGLPSSWPFTADDSPVAGAQLAYFVDPATQLPAYMQIAYTPVTASQGYWQNQQIEYSFGALPLIQTTNGKFDPITLSWPVAQL